MILCICANPRAHSRNAHTEHADGDPVTLDISVDKLLYPFDNMPPTHFQVSPRGWLVLSDGCIEAFLVSFRWLCFPQCSAEAWEGGPGGTAWGVGGGLGDGPCPKEILSDPGHAMLSPLLPHPSGPGTETS